MRAKCRMESPFYGKKLTDPPALRHLNTCEETGPD